ncbi:MAG: hypothetical protein H0W96_10540, partial [Solirubrobacterales bacterium]|nr:hypothetical protein [Solirubrobacterales bacterium]
VTPAAVYAAAETRTTSREAVAPPAAPPAPPPVPSASVELPEGCAIDLVMGVTPIIGTDGDDRLTGTPGDDFICGLGGNDIINGGAGNDRIDGGLGDDTIDGGDGDDILGGGDGDDTLKGGPGDDCMQGGDGLDSVEGGPGSDLPDDASAKQVVAGDGTAEMTRVSEEQQSADADPIDFPTSHSCTLTSVSPGGSPLGGVLDIAKKVVKKVANLGVEPAQADERVPPALAIAPLQRPLELEGNVARVRVTCGGPFATSEGTVTLTTFPETNDKRRELGQPTRFTCTPAQSEPVVAIELSEKDERLIEDQGLLRVRVTALAENDAGQTTKARSVFMIEPERP